MSTATAEQVISGDLRPLHLKVADAIKDKNNQNIAASSVGALAGAAAGVGMGYLSYIVGIQFLKSIGMASWYITAATVSGYLIMAAYGVWFAYTGWHMVRNPR